MTLTMEFQTAEIEAQSIQELSEHYGYPENVLIDGESAANPQTRLDFCKRSFADELGRIVRERLLANQTAALRAQINASLEATVIS